MIVERDIKMDVFKTEYEKIVSEISSSPYSHQLEAIKNVSKGRPIILYGAGKAVGIVLVVCRKCGLEITAICDSNKKGVYEKGEVSLPIISPQDLVEEYSDSSLIVTSWKFESEIRENLKSIGFDNDNIFSFWYAQRITPEIFNNDYYEGYKWAYDFYEDKLSKILVLDKISSYLTSKPLKPNVSMPMYYEDVIQLGSDEVFLDGGAYDGDSVGDFIKHTDGEYKYIYAFEPDTAPFGQLKEYSKGISNIKMYHVGLGATNSLKSLHFDGLVASGFAECKYFATTGTKLSDVKFKTEDKKVLSIDSWLREEKIEFMPTFIKLDVEGCEADVLTGSSELIRNCKPKLAISAYHEVEDIYKLPQTILEIRSDYKFALRQHDYGYYETILYAY